MVSDRRVVTDWYVSPIIAALFSIGVVGALQFGLLPVTLIDPWIAAHDAVEAISPGAMSAGFERLAIAAMITVVVSSGLALWGSARAWGVLARVGGVIHIVALGSLLVLWSDGTFSFILTNVADTDPWRSLPPSSAAPWVPLLLLPRLAVAGPIAFWVVVLVRRARRSPMLVGAQ